MHSDGLYLESKMWRTPLIAFALALAGGVAFLLDGAVLVTILDPGMCTASGPVPVTPCLETITLMGAVSWLGVGLLLVSFVILVDPPRPVRTVWGIGVLAASVLGGGMLFGILDLSGIAPAPWAQLVEGALYLPGVLLGLVGGSVALRLGGPLAARPVRPRAAG